MSELPPAPGETEGLRAWMAVLDRRLRLMAGIGVVALLAIGAVAAIALVQAGEEDGAVADRAGPKRSPGVGALKREVAELRGEVEKAGADDGDARLAKRVKKLERTLRTLAPAETEPAEEEAESEEGTRGAEGEGAEPEGTADEPSAVAPGNTGDPTSAE